MRVCWFGEDTGDGVDLLLAFGACFFPTLLACVAIMISRREPRWLLIAFYAGGLLTSVSTGIAVLAVFVNGEAVLGSTRSDPHPTTSIVAGLVALLFAWLMVSARGHAMLDRWRSRHRRHTKSKQEDRPFWAERRLGRASWKIAFLVGAVINLPGPFYLLALGKIAHGSYSTVQQVALILLFNAIMFLLLEVPFVGYLVRPEATAMRVTAMSRWLNANGLRITGWFVGLFGASLLAQGLAALAG
jgi:Sap, sulfolipid-1-addressing protein